MSPERASLLGRLRRSQTMVAAVWLVAILITAGCGVAVMLGRSSWGGAEGAPLSGLEVAALVLCSVAAVGAAVAVSLWSQPR